MAFVVFFSVSPLSLSLSIYLSHAVYIPVYVYVCMYMHTEAAPFGENQRGLLENNAVRIDRYIHRYIDTQIDRICLAPRGLSLSDLTDFVVLL